MAAVPAIGRAREVEQSFAHEAQLTERLYERHHRRVLGFCLYQLRDREEAADAVQTTYLYALGALRRGVVPAFEAPWLMAIARNVCRSRWDAGKRRREVEFAQDPHRLEEFAPGREASDGLLGLDDALAGLPGPQRRAVLLRDWQGLSYQEVATELDVSVSAAETLIFRGREALARSLNGEGTERKRRFGLGSLLSTFKPGLFGGSVAAKVAVGTALVGLGVTGGTMISGAPGHPSTPTPVTKSGGSPGSELARITPKPTRAGPAAAGTPRRAARQASRAAPVSPVRGGGSTAPAAEQSPAISAIVVPPAGPTPNSRQPSVPQAATAAPAPGSPPVTKTTADQPVKTVSTAVAPVVAKTADTVQSVVTTVTGTATPAVAAVVTTAEPVVDAVTSVAGVTLPPVPTVPPVTVTVPPLHLP